MRALLLASLLLLSSVAFAADSRTPSTSVRLTGDNASTPNSVFAFPAGFLRVSDEPSQIFYDPFDGSVIDTTNRYNAATTSGSPVAPSQASGALTLGTGTVASSYTYLQSQATFIPTIPAWLGVSFAIKVENPVLLNGDRFWGMGTSPGSPTTAAPITDGVGFELEADGKLYAVVHAAGVRTNVADLSSSGNSKQPTDANYHRYITYVRTDKTFWYIDSLDVPVATSSFQSPAVQTLPLKFSAVAATPTAPTSTANIVCAGVAIWDTGKNNKTISDGTFGWRKVTVKAGSTAAAAADSPLVVALHPTSPLPTGSNTIGALTANQSVNVAQIAGVAVSTGSGPPDTGTQRVFVAQRRTYSAGTTIKTNTAAGTAPFFTICGSATQTVRVQKVTVTGTVATAAVFGDLVLKKTSAATSGGTATALTKVPHDSNSAAATANLVNYYTVLATAGALVGVVAVQQALFPATATATLSPAVVTFFDLNRDPVEAAVLRGIAQCLEASFATTTTNVPTLTVNVTWTEE